MPVHKTQPGVEVSDLVAILESRNEEIVSVTYDPRDSEWVVVTKPSLRIVTNMGATETRR